MKLMYSTTWTEAAARADAAYTAYETRADKEDDTTPEMDAASQAEVQVMMALLRDTPARTPLDLADRMARLTKREIDSGWDDWPAITARIQRDLEEMARPAPSPEIAGAFAAYLEARGAEEDTVRYPTDRDMDVACEATSAAFNALMALPCGTPGDLIVKVYVDRVDEHNTHRSARPDAPASGSLTEVDLAELREGEPNSDYRVDRARIAVFRDILDTDLGRCMFALESIDFDASAWVRGARRAGIAFYVVVQQDGREGLYIGEPDEPLGQQPKALRDALVALISAFRAKERTGLVIQEVVANHPDLLVHARVGVDA